MLNSKLPARIGRISNQTLGFLLSLLVGCSAFTVGPPPLPTLCKTMNPQHHDYRPQTTESPYLLTVDRTEVGPEQNVQLTLYTTDPKSTPIIGFYLQARDDDDNLRGSFSPNRHTKVHNCFGKRANAAHHADGTVKKDNITISWTAPSNWAGEVVFTATSMRDFVTYWVFIQSEPVLVTNPAATASSAPPLRRTTPRPRPPLDQSLQNFFNSIGSIFTFTPRNGTERRCTNSNRVFNNWFCNLFPNSTGTG